MKTLLLALFMCNPAWAGIYVCHLTDGRTLYQDVPCAQAPSWAMGEADVLDQDDIALPPSPPAEDVARASRLAEVEIAAVEEIRKAEEAARQARAIREAEEQRRRNDFYRRCRSIEAMVHGYERTAKVYWGDPRYQERATVAREQFRFECW